MPYKVGLQIKAIREKRGVSQTELANETFVARNSLSQVESGRRNPSPAVLASLTSKLNENRPLSESESISLIAGVLEDAFAGASCVAEPRSEAGKPMPDLLLHLASGSTVTVEVKKQSSKTFRSDTVQIMEAVNKNGAFRSACQFFAGDKHWADVITKVAKNRKKLKMLEAISDIPEEKLGDAAQLLDSLRSLKGERLRILTIVLKSLAED